jgi:hypothetical protein
MPNGRQLLHRAQQGLQVVTGRGKDEATSTAWTAWPSPGMSQPQSHGSAGRARKPSATRIATRVLPEPGPPANNHTEPGSPPVHHARIAVTCFR